MPLQPYSKVNGLKPTGSDSRYSGKPVTKVITNGFFMVDQKWTVTYWNLAAEKLLGVPSKDMIGTNLWDKFAGTVPLDFYKNYHEALLQDIPAYFKEYWGEIGTWFDVNTYYSKGVLSVSFKKSDQLALTERPKQQLKILNELYRFVTEITNDCLWEWDLRLRELFWIDGGHKRFFGYQIENALIPQSFWEDRIHPEDKLRILAKLSKVINEGPGGVWEEEYRFERANGDYAYVHDRGHIIYQDGKASRMIGATQDITARKLSENQLLQERLARQQEITHAVLVAQETERADIGRELHDNLNQILGAAKLYIEMARVDEESSETCLEKASGYLIDVIEEIRRISKRLATPGMVMGLVESINILADDLTAIQPLKIRFYKNGINEEDLDQKLQLDIFRMVQEQLNNIVKHANATDVTINLTRQANEITLLISDNGIGCDLSAVKNGVGIINITGRAELYQGRVAILSKPGEGYELKVVLPHRPHPVSVLKSIP
jgi:PAS domain S-box-containing protein